MKAGSKRTPMRIPTSPMAVSVERPAKIVQTGGQLSAFLNFGPGGARRFSKVSAQGGRYSPFSKFWKTSLNFFLSS